MVWSRVHPRGTDRKDFETCPRKIAKLHRPQILDTTHAGPANESTPAHFGPHAHPIPDDAFTAAHRQNTGTYRALSVQSAR